MGMHIQNRHDFDAVLRAVLDSYAPRAWEYSSVDARAMPDGSSQVRYVIHDAGGNELRTVLETRPRDGEPTYTLEE
jgi:hypothetical protein